MKPEFKTVSDFNLKLPTNTTESYSEDFGVKTTEALRESLSAIKEVRHELQEAYSDNKNMQVTIEQLNNSIATHTQEKAITAKTIETLTRELKKYKDEETHRLNAVKSKRLEKLSKNFEALGKTKTVEQLSRLSDAVISEFEEITDGALELNKTANYTVGITPSQSFVASHSIESLSSDNEITPQKSFEEAICETLTQQQNNGDNNKKRIKFL